MKKATYLRKLKAADEALRRSNQDLARKHVDEAWKMATSGEMIPAVTDLELNRLFNLRDKIDMC